MTNGVSDGGKVTEYLLECPALIQTQNPLNVFSDEEPRPLSADHPPKFEIHEISTVGHGALRIGYRESLAREPANDYVSFRNSCCVYLRNIATQDVLTKVKSVCLDGV